MVLLTMTASIVDSLERLGTLKPPDTPETSEPSKQLGSTDATKSAANDSSPPEPAKESEVTPDSTTTSLSEPSLENPAVGNPVAHSQVVDLWSKLKTSDAPCSLEDLLRGSQVYMPPAPSKPEPTPQFKALMARLRREEEARSYRRMVSSPNRFESFNDRFPKHASASAFAEVNRPTRAADMGDDGVSLDEVHRQVTLILNFLLSILGVAGTLWVLARWWSLPARLFLTMGGSILVGVAEVAVYSGYMFRMGEAKQKQDAVKEVKEVVKTWVVGKDADGTKGGEEVEPVLLETKDERGRVRKRNAAAKEGT